VDATIERGVQAESEGRYIGYQASGQAAESSFLRQPRPSLCVFGGGAASAHRQSEGTPSDWACRESLVVAAADQRPQAADHSAAVGRLGANNLQ